MTGREERMTDANARLANLPDAKPAPTLASPHFADIPAALEAHAHAFREAHAELASAWQDESAGIVWADFAVILERAAASARRAIRRRGLE